MHSALSTYSTLQRRYAQQKGEQKHNSKPKYTAADHHTAQNEEESVKSSDCEGRRRCTSNPIRTNAASIGSHHATCNPSRQGGGEKGKAKRAKKEAAESTT